MQIRLILASCLVWLAAWDTPVAAAMVSSDCQPCTVCSPAAGEGCISQDGGTEKAKKFGQFLDKLKGAVDGLSAKNLEGTWSYTGADLKIESDDVVSRVGGQLASRKLENILNAQLQKMGIEPGRYVITFRADGTYQAQVGKRHVEGKYTLDKETKQIVMTPKHGLSHSEMKVDMLGREMSLLYDSSKFIDVAKNISGVVGKHSSLKIVDTMLQNCKGMFVGLKFAKQ